MQRKHTLGLLAVITAVFAVPVAAQSGDEVRQEVETLRRQMSEILQRQAALEASNSALKADNESLRRRVDEAGAAVAESLETRINALTDDLSGLSGTTVQSVANPIKITGEARVRGGYTANRNFGVVTAGSDDDDGTFIDARFNLGFDFTLVDDVATHFELISAGLYDNGQTDHNTGNLDEVDLYQGWILFSNMFGRKEIGLRTGRQEIVLGNEFQFGNNDFFDGETFDSTLFWWNDDNFRLIAVWAKLATTNSYNPSNHPYTSVGVGNGHDDDEAYVLYATFKGIKDHEIDLYYAFLNGQNAGSFGTLGNSITPVDIFAHVVGARIGGKFDVAAGLDYNLEGAYEFGELNEVFNAAGDEVDVEGFAVEGTIGITFSAESKARLYGMFIYADGGDDDGTGYVPLFPEAHAQTNWDDHTSRRARWGQMDIIPMSNVLAGQIGFNFRPNDDWILGAAVIASFHDEDVLAIDGTTSDDLGYELDLYADHRVNAQTTIGFGLGLFMPENGAPLQGGTFVGDDDDDIAVLFYLQTRVLF